MLTVSRNGTNYVNCYPETSEEDTTRIALELCEHRAQEACGVAVKTGRLVEFQESPSILSYPDTLDPYAVPFLTTNGRRWMLGVYRNESMFKAVAMTRFGYAITVGGRRTPKRAEEDAMKFCERNNGRQGLCFLYAAGSKVVFDERTDIYGDR